MLVSVRHEYFLCTLFKGLDNEIRNLKRQGVHVLAYINPNLNIDGDLYKEGEQLGVFVKNSSGLPYITDFGEFFCATVDLTSESARNWYIGILDQNKHRLFQSTSCPYWSFSK